MMNQKLKEAATWGKINAIIGMIGSAMSILTIIGIPVGVLSLLGFLKLNQATDELKLLSQKETTTTEEYENLMETYGNYHKMLGIAQITGLVMAILGMLFWIALIMIFAATFDGMPRMMRGYYY